MLLFGKASSNPGQLAVAGTGQRRVYGAGNWRIDPFILTFLFQRPVQLTDKLHQFLRILFPRSQPSEILPIFTVLFTPILIARHGKK